MKAKFRTTTALIASLSITMGHVPLTAFAQEVDLDQCMAEETEEECLARLLEEGAPGMSGQAQQGEPGNSGQAARGNSETAPGQTGDMAEPATGDVSPDSVAEEVTQQPDVAVDTDVATEAEGMTDGTAPGAEVAAEGQGMVETEADDTDVAAEVERDVDAEATGDGNAAAEAGTMAETEIGNADIAVDAEGGMEMETGTEGDAAAEADVMLDTEADVAVDGEGMIDMEVDGDMAGAADADAMADTDMETAEMEAGTEAEAEAMTDADAGMVDDTSPVVTEEELTAEDLAEIEAAREAAEAAETEMPEPMDPVAEAEEEIARAEEEAEAAQQSLALQEEAEPVDTDAVEVTEETARQSSEDFERLKTAEDEDRAERDDRGGLSGIEGLLLGGAAGLFVGSILSGNREVVSRSDDRVVLLRPEGDYQVIRDDDALLRRPGNQVSTDRFSDGSTRNIVTQPDGTQIITVRDADLRILRRTVVAPDGTRTVLIDDIAVERPVRVSELPPVTAPQPSPSDTRDLARALEAQAAIDRGFSLAQIRSIRAVRDLAPAVNLDTITFATGSAAITPDQAADLLALGEYMSAAIADDPQEIFLIEGHTDAVGSAAYNLALSDRRAETVALALTEYFDVPPQNMVIQGYGEEFLLGPTLESERGNRRVAVRQVTELLQVASAQ